MDIWWRGGFSKVFISSFTERLKASDCKVIVSMQIACLTNCLTQAMHLWSDAAYDALVKIKYAALLIICHVSVGTNSTLNQNLNLPARCTMSATASLRSQGREHLTPNTASLRWQILGQCTESRCMCLPSGSLNSACVSMNSAEWHSFRGKVLYNGTLLAWWWGTER